MNFPELFSELKQLPLVQNVLQGNFSKLFSDAVRWPLVQQLLHGYDGTGPESYTEKTRDLRARIDQSQDPDLKVSKSICPYCAVGCGQLGLPQARQGGQH